MDKKFLILSISFFLVFGILISEKVVAGTQHNVSGFAWSENIGWISFNSLNCDPDGDGKSNGIAGCPPAGTSIANYGVNLDFSTKIFSGYAWSENIGWITFNESELSGCPQTPCRAWLDSDNKVYGWARALAGGGSNAGGWDGWIRLRDTNYGVTFNPSTKEFEGWAAGWDDSPNSAVIGWISFNCKNQNSCATSSYKVFIIPNQPPQITEFKVIDDPCRYESSPLTIPERGYAMWINWDATDPDGDSLTAKITIVGGDTNFSTTTPNKSFLVPGEAEIDFNTQYSITLEVSDGKDSVSTSTTFTTPLHQFPYVNFKWSPEKPFVDQLVQFCSVSTGTCATIISESEQSECYAPSCDFEWTFTNAIPSNSTLPNPQVQFTQATSVQAKLKITASDLNGYCEKTVTFNVKRPLPFWELMKLKIESFFASLAEFLKKILMS